jgi:hypothetical protein
MIVFLVGIDRVNVPSLPVRVSNLKQCITTAAASAEEDMPRGVWMELDYVLISVM